MTERIEELTKGAAQLGITLDNETAGKLLAYLDLLYKWNRAYNLTAIRDEKKAIALQLLDSLSLLPFIGEGPLLDIGSGGGLPGIPIAICRPEQPVTLLDSNGKKTRFLSQARVELGLDNVQVVNERIEAWRPGTLPGIITSRAFASLDQILDWCRHLLTPETRLVAMKGQYPQLELDEISERNLEIEVEQVSIPGIDAQRHIVIIHGFSM
ncbi:MAG: 16S rRNA (guanine(527)-N(7))-methyltransferase RsmG [Gammaproteobacteria bacterium]|jgi:16S rRNA (guanine527-N7)-methyltransferase